MQGGVLGVDGQEFPPPGSQNSRYQITSHHQALFVGQGEAVAGHAWSVAAIANLVAWVDETTSRLGPTHLHMIIDLARFAGLLPQEAEETLLKVIKLASSRKDSTTASVNDILVALRQLEAIFQGAEADDLSISLRRQSAGRTR